MSVEFRPRNDMVRRRKWLIALTAEGFAVGLAIGLLLAAGFEILRLFSRTAIRTKYLISFRTAGTSTRGSA